MLFGRKIFNGTNERETFSRSETGSPRLLWKTTKVLARLYFIEGTLRYYTHRCVDGECTRVFYLQLQPWFSLPAALPEPANDRISLTYPVLGRLSLSLSPSLFYAPFSFAGQPPLFQPTSLWSVVQVNSRETCIKPPWTPFKRAFLTCHCWPGGRGKFLHLSTSSPLPAIHNFEVGFFLPRVITRYSKNWRICWSLFGKKLASIRQGIFEKFLFQKFWNSTRNSGESAY